MFNDLISNKNLTPQQPETDAPLALSADWFDVDDSWKPALPEGEYIVKVSSYQLHRSKKDASSISYKWGLTVVEGPYAGKDITHFTWLGRQNAQGQFADKEQGRGFRMFLAAIGVTPKTMPQLVVNGEFKLTDEAVLNNTLKVAVIHERVLRQDAEGKPAAERTNEDYMVNLKVNRVYPVEPAGKKFAGANAL